MTFAFDMLKKYAIVVDLTARTLAELRIFRPARFKIEKIGNYYGIYICDLPTVLKDGSGEVLRSFPVYVTPKGIAWNGRRTSFLNIDEPKAEVLLCRDSLETYSENVSVFMGKAIKACYGRYGERGYFRLIYKYYLYNKMTDTSLPADSFLWDKDAFILNELTSGFDILDYEDFSEFMMKLSSDRKKKFVSLVGSAEQS